MLIIIFSACFLSLFIETSNFTPKFSNKFQVSIYSSHIKTTFKHKMVEVEARAVQVPRPREPIRGKLLVMGEPAVGKSTLIKRWVTGEFSSKYEPTIGIDFHSKLVDGLSV